MTGHTLGRILPWDFVKVAPNGRLVLPAQVRQRMGIEEGGNLILDETEEGVVLRTLEQVVRRAQAISRRVLAGKAGVSVDDFLAERRQMWGEDKEG
jgi:AbrB family looped-hinge helix DNA binding protein